MCRSSVEIFLGVFVLLLAAPVEAQTEPPWTAVDRWMGEAETALRQGESQLAESLYRSALLEGWLLLGDLAVAEGDLVEARNAYRTASEVAVERKRPLTALALVDLRAGQSVEAIATSRDLLSRDPFDVPTRRLLAQALVSAGLIREAVQELSEVVEDHPEDLETAFSLASGLLRLEDVEAADTHFERLAEGRPIPQTHVLIGRTYRDFKHYERARRSLERALALDSKTRRAHYYLGTVTLLEDGKARLDEAIAHFEHELELAPDDPLCNLFLGMALVEGRRWEEALAPLDIAAGASDSRTDALHFRGRALFGLERFDEAIVPLGRALELIEGNPERLRTADPSQLEGLHYQRAQALRRLGREDEARHHFDAAKAAAENLAQTSRERLSRYLDDALTRDDTPGGFAPMLEVPAVARLEPAARGSLRTALTRHLARAYLNLGIQQVQKQRFARAVGLFEGTVTLAPDFPQAQRSLAIARFNAGQLAEAIDPLEQALGERRADTDLRRMLALAKLEVSAYGEAAELLRADPARDRDPSLQYTYGMALVRSGQTAEARDIFDRLMAENTEWPELQVLLGQANAQDGNFEAALAALDKALELDPTVAEAHGTLGVIHLRRGELEKAEEALWAELDGHPGDRRARYHLATVLDLRDRPEEAEIQLRALLDTDPSDADARYLLGKILLTRGVLAEATAQLEAAAQLSPKDPNIFNQLGRAYQQQGKGELARAQFERFRQLKKAQREESP